MRKLIDQIIGLFHRKKKTQEPKKKESPFNRIKGVPLNEQELKAWLKHPTTLKMVRLLKIHKLNFIDGLIKNPEKLDKSLVLGRCKGYDDIIELIEETASNPEDIEAMLEVYLNNLKIKI